MFSCRVIGHKHLLIQLWINRVTAEGLNGVLCTDSAVASQLETHQSLALLFSGSFHRGCHLSYSAQSHIIHTVYTVHERRNTLKNKDVPMSVQWHKHRQDWNVHICALSLPLAHSFLFTATYCRSYQCDVSGEKKRDMKKWWHGLALAQLFYIFLNLVS